MQNKPYDLLNNVGVDGVITSIYPEFCFVYFELNNWDLDIFVPNYSFDNSVYKTLKKNDIIKGTVKKQLRGKHKDELILINCEKIDLFKRSINENYN